MKRNNGEKKTSETLDAIVYQCIDNKKPRRSGSNSNSKQVSSMLVAMTNACPYEDIDRPREKKTKKK